MELQEYLFREIKNKLDYLDQEFEYSLEVNFDTNKDSTKSDMEHFLGRLFSDLRQYLQNIDELKRMMLLLEKEVLTAQDNSVNFESEDLTDTIVKSIKNVTGALSDDEWKSIIREQKRFEKLNKEVDEEEETAQ